MCLMTKRSLNYNTTFKVSTPEWRASLPWEVADLGLRSRWPHGLLTLLHLWSASEKSSSFVKPCTPFIVRNIGTLKGGSLGAHMAL